MPPTVNQFIPYLTGEAAPGSISRRLIMKQSQILESQFRAVVDSFLDTLEHTYSMSIQQTSIRGDADKILCSYGFFIWMELKADNGKVDKLQAYKASVVRSKGHGIAFVARPKNWHLVQDFLKILDSGIMDKNLLKEVMESNK